MKVSTLMKNAPNSVIYSVAGCFVAVIAAFTVLSAIGANTADLRAFLVPIGAVLSTLLSGGALIVSGAAAHSSNRADNQTNGQLDKLNQELESLRAYKLQRETSDQVARSADVR